MKDDWLDKLLVVVVIVCLLGIALTGVRCEFHLESTQRSQSNG